MNLLRVIEKSAGSFPDKTFIVCEKEKRTFKVFYERVKNLGAGMDSLGIKKGDKVAILLNNCGEYVEIYFAAISRGAIVVPVNTFLKTEEVAFILNDCGVRALFTSSDFSAVAVSLDRATVPALERVVVVDEIKGLDCVKYAGLFMAALEPVDADSDDIAAILYTSGTTGHPKGAMLTHKNLISDVENSTGIIGITHRDVFMCFLPMFHSFSFMANVMVPLYCGCRIVILRSIQPFTKVIKNMLFQRVSVFVAIPQVFILMAEKHVPFFVLLFNSIRICISGGASIPVESIKKFEAKFKKPLVEGYGLSEASPICALNPLYGRRVAGSIGPAINNVEIVIRDDSGMALPDGETGELTVKGENVMKGYYNNPGATDEALKDGWLYTGDIGKKDSAGYVYILDRKKDMIIVNGMNVYPREVEEVLYKNPAVAEACVVGEKDELHGEIPVAVLVLKEGFAEDEHVFRKFCREHIANYKVPHRIEFWKELPKNSTGKVLKKDIRDMIEARKKRV